MDAIGIKRDEQYECMTDSANLDRLENKVNTICEQVRSVLFQRDQKKYIQAILSTYVRSTPSDLESALRLLAELKSMKKEKN